MPELYRVFTEYAAIKAAAAETAKRETANLLEALDNACAREEMTGLEQAALEDLHERQNAE